MKKQEFVELESLVNTRDKLVKLRTKLKNKIHNLLLANGILTKREQFSSQKSLERVKSLQGLSEVSQFELDFVCDEISHLNEKIKVLDEKIISIAEDIKGFKNLTSIKGIGERSAAILLSTIGNVEDFKTQKNLDAYFGIVPRVKNTSNTINHGRITKRGSQVARATLIQCTLIAIRYSPYLRDFFKKLKAAK
ncbi:MAG: transposase, partial [Spirochaetia bacterium]|nr:transposase [Spirochaetia bacterium]